MATSLVRIMADFITGATSLRELEELVESRLFELRQTPEINEEKRVLSAIQLLLHERREGRSTEFDIYANAQAFLDRLLHMSVHGEKGAIQMAFPESTRGLSKRTGSESAPTRYEDLTPVG